MCERLAAQAGMLVIPNFSRMDASPGVYTVGNLTDGILASVLFQSAFDLLMPHGMVMRPNDHLPVNNTHMHDSRSHAWC